jgi:hypothetical protein
MDPSHFDRATKQLVRAATRRQALASLGAGVCAFVLPTGASARKRRKKKPTVNRFGCLNVGRPCRGNDRQCCSGICRGKTPKPGEKDKSRCVPHDTGGCRAGQSRTVCGGLDEACTSKTGETGRCETTTGNAGYCEVTGSCFPCKRDADCRPFCGPQAACIQCAQGCSPLTACVGPTADACTFA